jgi:hypothetical protein
MPVIPFNSGRQEKNNWKKWRAEEEERHKGPLTPIFIRQIVWSV